MKYRINEKFLVLWINGFLCGYFRNLDLDTYNSCTEFVALWNQEKFFNFLKVLINQQKENCLEYLRASFWLFSILLIINDIE